MSCVAPAFSRPARRAASISPSGTVALGDDDAVILAVPPYVAAALVPGLADADRVPRHRQRAFSRRSAGASAADARRHQRHREWIFAHPGRISVTISDAGQLVRHAARGAGADDLARGRQRSRACRKRCRRGRSCASGARPSPRRRSRTPSVPAARDGLEQSVPGRRLDRDRPAGDARRRHALGLSRGRAGRPLRCEPPHDARITPRAAIAAARARRRAIDESRDARACSQASRPTAIGCSSSKPTRRFPPNTCCCGTIAASRSTPSWSARSPSICAASRASMAAGRCSMTATST